VTTVSSVKLNHRLGVLGRETDTPVPEADFLQVPEADSRQVLGVGLPRSRRRTIDLAARGIIDRIRWGSFNRPHDRPRWRYVYRSGRWVVHRTVCQSLQKQLASNEPVVHKQCRLGFREQSVRAEHSLTLILGCPVLGPAGTMCALKP
jgi:hypothetical protein